MDANPYDVAIVGAGPGGSTTGALVCKYAPELRVIILERDTFPRDHVGESQLAPIGAILHEMGCWDAVEAANFPIKIGATYRWGRNDELWDFDFVSNFEDAPRPAAYAGQRQHTALQVDRAKYDDILLRHAASLGCEVRQGVGVTAVQTRDDNPDHISALVMADGERIIAREYIDASGHAGVIRRALGVEVECPTALKNVAIWDYWENATWAVEVGTGGTRVQVMSVGYGWLWFIPLGPTRTSIGLICPAQYYKDANTSAEQLYLSAVRADPRIGPLCEGATRRGKLETTKDWSFLSARATGDNWMLVGESVGFADPILAAGMTLTQTGAREAAYTLLELIRGEHDPAWLREHYGANQRARIHQHIRFADFWYAANAQFSDLQDHCRAIAAEAGLELSSEQAWAWLAQGGFANDTIGQAGIGGLDLAGLKQITQRFTKQQAKWSVSDHNVLELALAGAQRSRVPIYSAGKIVAIQSFQRDGKRLAITGLYQLVIAALQRSKYLDEIVAFVQATLTKQLGPQQVALGLQRALTALEVLLSEGWVIGRFDPTRSRVTLSTPDEGPLIHRTPDDG